MNERDWSRDRQRFVSDADQARRRDQQPRRDHGFPLGPLGREFAALTYALLDADTVEDVLEQVVTATAKVTAGADVVSVTLRSPDGSFFTPVFTHSIARDVDELQYSFGEGPCMTAAEDPGPAITSWRDLRADAPWPRFAPAACEAGIHAVLSVSLLPAPIPPRLSGALNVYSRSIGGLDTADKDIILLLATHASLALATTEAVTTSKLRDTQLHKAIDSRDVIGQAKGILMNRRGISAEQAFDILRHASQTLNIKLVRIAELVAADPDVLD